MDFLTKLDEAINEAIADGATREDILSELEMKVMSMKEEMASEED